MGLEAKCVNSIISTKSRRFQFVGFSRRSVQANRDVPQSDLRDTFRKELRNFGLQSSK